MYHIPKWIVWLVVATMIYSSIANYCRFKDAIGYPCKNVERSCFTN